MRNANYATVVPHLVRDLLYAIKYDDQYVAEQTLEALWNVPEDEREAAFPTFPLA